MAGVLGPCLIPWGDWGAVPRHLADHPETGLKCRDRGMRQCEALRGWECGKKPLEALIDQSLTPSRPLFVANHARGRQRDERS